MLKNAQRPPWGGERGAGYNNRMNEGEKGRACCDILMQER